MILVGIALVLEVVVLTGKVLTGIVLVGIVLVGRTASFLYCFFVSIEMFETTFLGAIFSGGGLLFLKIFSFRIVRPPFLDSFVLVSCSTFIFLFCFRVHA